MSGITLERRELLVLMDALNCMSIVGVDSATLFPVDREKHRALIFEGIELLQKHGLMEIRDGKHILSTDLLRLAAVIAGPTVVIETIRGMPDGKQMKYLHYLVPPKIVELSFPDEQQYAIGLIAQVALMLARIEKIIPIQPPQLTQTFAGHASKHIVSEMLSLDRVGELNEAEATTALRDEGMSEEGTRRLLAAFKEPVFAGTVTLMQVREGTVVARWNVTVVQGKDVAWQLRTDPDSPSQVEIATVDAAALRTTLEQWLRRAAGR